MSTSFKLFKSLRNSYNLADLAQKEVKKLDRPFFKRVSYIAEI